MSDFPEKYPNADQRYFSQLKGVGSMESGPKGVTLHYTADRDLLRTIQSLKARDLAYHLIIDRQGQVFQFASLRDRVWHAGKAIWEQQSPNRSHISISLLSWGELTLEKGKYLSWNDTEINPSEVRTRAGEHWDRATNLQEAALEELLRWLVDKGIDVSNICGHDECALPHGRKSDPGGILASDMSAIRESLRAYVGAKSKVMA